MKTIWPLLALAGLAACGPQKAHRLTVVDLVTDPIQLQVVLDRCAADPQKAAGDVECTNAKLAVERRAVEEEARNARQRQQEFERRREERRAQDDQLHGDRTGAKAGFDPYTAPLTVEPAAQGAPSKP